MRRELQVEPLILCLAQPAPSGTRAYQPKLVDDEKSHPRNKHYPNINNQKGNPNQNNNRNNPSTKNPQQLSNKQYEKNSMKVPSEKTEEVSQGRTRRRRSAVTT